MALMRTTNAARPPAEPTPQPGFDELLSRLTETDRELRRRAAFALDAADPAAAVPALLARVGEETDPTVRDAVLTVLAGHDDLTVARSLVAHLTSEDAGLRTAVVGALSSMPGSVPHLLPALVVDPDPDVRILTAMLLADLEPPVAVAWLVEMILSDDHPNVVGTAIDSLQPYFGSEHIGLLEATRDRFRRDPFLRFVIDTALARLNGGGNR
ncbi:HEAT repeat domain-containing protein [Pengzhenrongella sicca]|uniref:HEAT repeat domain-containing protein n=1 Tax=Pengzhenrongella sicca TaxID=2819238 RepID=A0A8A4ZDE8_9MICO|nr:HEAT repeat domain-containing protein [Pengzhenrongella sicca]QTE29355.1 HEAT repeat domain-containing protein [Pengzhenrongella sicca]